jgi:hypothetical protein
MRAFVCKICFLNMIRIPPQNTHSHGLAFSHSPLRHMIDPLSVTATVAWLTSTQIRILSPFFLVFLPVHVFASLFHFVG